MDLAEIVTFARDAAPVATYVVISAAAAAHAFAGFARGLEALARRSESKADDAAAVKLRAWAEAVDRFLSKVSALHASIFPRGRA